VCDIKAQTVGLSQRECAPGRQQLTLICLFLITWESASAIATFHRMAVKSCTGTGRKRSSFGELTEINEAVSPDVI